MVLIRREQTAKGSARAASREQVQKFPQSLADVLNLRRNMGRKWDRGLRLIGFAFRAQLLARPRDGESLLVEQLLDAQDAFYVALAVHALPRAAFDRLQLREFRFPEAEHVCRQMTKDRDFADAEVQLIRDEDFIRLMLRPVFLSCGHFVRTGKCRAIGLL